jgi:hypothetical protein
MIKNNTRVPLNYIIGLISIREKVVISLLNIELDFFEIRITNLFTDFKPWTVPQTV